jgi:hypothetical protein
LLFQEHFSYFCPFSFCLPLEKSKWHSVLEAAKLQLETLQINWLYFIITEQPKLFSHYIKIW